MNWRTIYFLYRAELRAAFRERNIVINTVLMPALLYPVLLWVMFNGLLFVQGQAESMGSRVVLVGLPPEHDTVRGQIDTQEDLEIVEQARPFGEEEIRRALSEETVDAVVTFEPRPGSVAESSEAGSSEATAADKALDDNFTVRISYDSSHERSSIARGRLHALLNDYRKDWFRERAGAYLPPEDWDEFRIVPNNVATASQMGAMILGMLLPLYFVIMVAVGCMYPAIDSTAGERERGTWETTLTIATSRLSVVTAKYLYVSSLGFLAGALNLTAMTLTMGSVMAPLLQGEGEAAVEFGIPLAAIPLLFVGSLLLAASVAAAMMIFSAFARTFKEGQAMVGPIYIATFLPVLFLTREGIELTVGLACIPVVNVAMMVREAISGSFPAIPILVTFAVQALVIAALLRLAARILTFEDVVVGSYEGNFVRFLRRRLFRSSARRNT